MRINYSLSWAMALHISELQQRLEQKQLEALLGPSATSLLSGLQQSTGITQQGTAEEPESDKTKQHKHSL